MVLFFVNGIPKLLLRPASVAEDQTRNPSAPGRSVYGVWGVPTWLQQSRTGMITTLTRSGRPAEHCEDGDWFNRMAAL